MLTDRGTEFTAHAFQEYLRQLGVEHRMTTPAHPQCNGRIERFNRTLKELIQKLVDNDAARWEHQLGHALMAYRNSVSTTTGYSPFYLLHGRRCRMPLYNLLRLDHESTFEQRLNDLAEALRIAKHNTELSRRHNKHRLQQKANTGQLEPGDFVVIKADLRATFTARWDPQYQVTRVRGPVVFLRQQQTGKTKILNREKVVLVDPDLAWDECNPRPRPRRQVRPAAAPKPPHQPPDQLPSSDDDGETADRPQIPPPPDPQPTTSNERPQRHRRLTERAREALEDEDIIDAGHDLIIRHLRKRLSNAPSPIQAKRARCETVEFVRGYSGSGVQHDRQPTDRTPRLDTCDRR